MAEWLRRLTRNQLGSSRVGSNPTRSDFLSSPHEKLEGTLGLGKRNLPAGRSTPLLYLLLSMFCLQHPSLILSIEYGPVLQVSLIKAVIEVTHIPGWPSD